MDFSAVVYALAGLIGLWMVSQIYSRTEIQRAKFEHDAQIQKAETYANRHIQQAKYEAMGYNYGFNDSPGSSPDLSSLGDIGQLLPLIQSPQVQELLNKYLKKGD